MSTQLHQGTVYTSLMHPEVEQDYPGNLSSLAASARRRVELSRQGRRQQRAHRGRLIGATRRISLGLIHDD
jgi:hypothetical protein